MPRTQSTLIPAIVLTCLSFTGAISAGNCIKGKPCGNGCIAKTKSCHIDTPTNANGVIEHNASVIRRSYLKLPELYQVTTTSVYAVDEPQSKNRTAHYRQGQKVFVYKTEQGWARISNMDPEEWIELKHLQPLKD